MNWLRSTLTDETGRYDVAYVSLFAVMSTVCGAITAMTVTSVFAYMRCRSFEVNSVIVNCTFDPQPLGIAIGAACGGFATALGALAGYMLATRSPRSIAASVPASVPQAQMNVSVQP